MPRALILLVLATSIGAARHSAAIGPAVGPTADITAPFIEAASPQPFFLATTIL